MLLSFSLSLLFLVWHVDAGRLRQTDVFRDVEKNNGLNYKTLYYRQQVDHFSFANEDTYEQRYLVNDEHWDTNGGPVFFYTGNEGDITWFCNNTGALWDWAPEFKAMLVFAEHRYYGSSLPYGKDSYKDLAHLGYLSSEQALADFATLIDHLKATVPGAGDSPFVAFGGSYGGMLAAWMRMKYPHSVVGSLAASAPIWYFGNLVPCDTFTKVVTQDFKRTGPNCAANIRKSWDVISEIGRTAEGKDRLGKSFHLCRPLQNTADVIVLKEWLGDTYGNLAMVDYPYPANFLEPLPGWPIKVACSKLQGSGLEEQELVDGLFHIVDTYYNYTGSAKCLNTSQQGTKDLGDLGWDFQACSEMTMPMCSDGVNDMFERKPWDIKAFEEGCKKQWGVSTRPRWAIQEYGGRNITAASNIIFSNGLLDPWSGGGVMETLNPTLVAIVIEEGAHHLDLRSSNPEDPPSVIKARRQEKEIIRTWIQRSSPQNNGVPLQSGGGGDGAGQRLTAQSVLPNESESSVRPPGAVALLAAMTVFGTGCLVLAVFMGFSHDPLDTILRRRQRRTEKEPAKIESKTIKSIPYEGQTCEKQPLL